MAEEVNDKLTVLIDTNNESLVKEKLQTRYVCMSQF